MEQEPTKRARGTGSLFMRNGVWWYQLSVAGKVIRRSTGTNRRPEAARVLDGALVRHGLGDRLARNGICHAVIASMKGVCSHYAGDDEPGARQSYLYVVQHPVTRLIKIGRSVSPEKRIQALGKMSGANLLPLAIEREGGALTEGAVHAAFRAHRFHGEWFEDSRGEIVRWVQAGLPMPPSAS